MPGSFSSNDYLRIYFIPLLKQGTTLSPNMKSLTLTPSLRVLYLGVFDDIFSVDPPLFAV
jgi:hypothetical protein